MVISEEVHSEQITAGLEPQEIIISLHHVSPVAFYIRSSKQGTGLEVVIEDDSTDSSQGLCRNVKIRYITGRFLI